MITRINEEEIELLDRNFKVKSKVFIDKVIIDSPDDEWYFILINEKNKAPLELYHKNKGLNKNSYHFQGYFFELEYMYEYISTHKDKYKFVSKFDNRNNRMMKLFDKISSK